MTANRIHRLTADVRNPQSDAESIAWCRQEIIPAGTRLWVESTRMDVVDWPKRNWQATIRRQFAYVFEPLYALLARHLELEPDSVENIRYEHGDLGWETLGVLLGNGKVTLDEVRAAALEAEDD